jgi:lysyl-tRNA synthetase class I
MKIHDIFYTFLLRKVAMNSLIEQIQFSSFLVMMNDEEEYEVNDILNSRYHYEKLQYRIIWIDHSSNKAWYFAENFQNHSKEILNDYHQKYFAKLESKMRLIIIIETMLSQWIKNEHKKTKQLIQDVFNKMKTKTNNDRKRFNKNSFAIKILTRKES